MIDQVAVRFDNWSEEEQTRGGIAAWECGLESVYTHELIDYNTVGQDFSSDIFARAQYFAENGY